MFKSLANAVRFLSIDQVGNANSGHLGMPLGMSDCLTVLFKNILRFDPKVPIWPNRDRFIMSGGHGSAALYALLHLCGYEKYSINELKNFRKLGSITTGHPEYNPELGVETTTGPLGQGIANAIGIALGERILNARLGDDCINHYTYVIAGEGDLMEGLSHEACSFAGHLSLGRLIVLFDKNNITIDGNINICDNENTKKRFEAYGWHVQEINGHDEEQINQSILTAQNDKRPSIIICNTKIGYGTPREGKSNAHSGALSPEERNFACKYFGWEYSEFEIPEYIEKAWKVIGARNHEICKMWMKTQNQKYQSFGKDITKTLNNIFKKLKKEYFISRPFEATRISSQTVINEITETLPLFISGSCDLGKSTGCKSKNMKDITKEDFSGNYVNYGIREHAMAAIMNGMVTSHKIKCCGGTFLTFSDYMRPAIRMSALMNIPSIFVFSHDSIGVGEDGPTHQPIEHLASLRAIPNLNVLRPADALETAECWEIALKSQCPSALILSRQGVLSTRFSGRSNLCLNGAYLLNYDDNAEITLIASGSEVGIALELKKFLNDKYISVNIVSMPCCKLFEQQSNEYKSQILGKKLRVFIEASNGFGLEKYLGESGIFFGVKSFGVSCSAKDAFEHFQLTAKHIYTKILKKLGV